MAEEPGTFQRRLPGSSPALAWRGHSEDVERRRSPVGRPTESPRPRLEQRLGAWSVNPTRASCFLPPTYASCKHLHGPPPTASWSMS